MDASVCIPLLHIHFDKPVLVRDDQVPALSHYENLCVELSFD